MWKSPRHSFGSPMFLSGLALIPAAILIPRLFLPYLGPDGLRITNVVVLVLLIVLVPLMTLCNIGPNFIARREVAWRNGHKDSFEGEAAFEAVQFLPPILMRVRAVEPQKGKKAA